MVALEGSKQKKSSLLSPTLHDNFKYSETLPRHILRKRLEQRPRERLRQTEYGETPTFITILKLIVDQ